MGPERVLIMTERSHADALAAQLPELPKGNVVVEPARRGTAASLALAASVIRERRADAIMASVHSDAYIEDDAEFQRTLLAAFAAADDKRSLVLMGIQPSTPSEQLGYIEGGDTVARYGDYPVQRVARFVEKPKLEQAREYVALGRYYWNPGVFVWRVDVILDEFRSLQPAIHAPVTQIARAMADSGNDSALRQIYPTVPVETIDVGIMEKSDRVLVVPARFKWSDIGSWRELLEILPHDEDGNVVHGTHLSLGTRNSLIYGTTKPIATVGMDDVIVVEAEDVIFICPRDRAQDVKLLVERLAIDPERRALL